MATHSSIPAGRILWTEEPSPWGHKLSDITATNIYFHFLPDLLIFPHRCLSLFIFSIFHLSVLQIGSFTLTYIQIY